MRRGLAIAMRRRREMSSCSTMYCSALAPVKRARSLETILPALEKSRSEVTLVAGIESRYLAPGATRGKCISFSRHESSAVPRDPWSTVRLRLALHSTSRGTPPPKPAPTPGLALAVSTACGSRIQGVPVKGHRSSHRLHWTGLAPHGAALVRVLFVWKQALRKPRAAEPLAVPSWAHETGGVDVGACVRDEDTSRRFRSCTGYQVGMFHALNVDKTILMAHVTHLTPINADNFCDMTATPSYLK